MIELTTEVLKQMDSYSDDQEFFAYKNTEKDGFSIYYTYYSRMKSDGWYPKFEGTAFKLEVGATLEWLEASTDTLAECGAGVNVATLGWVKWDEQSWARHAGINPEDDAEIKCKAAIANLLPVRTFKVSFTKKDIACIPIDSLMAKLLCQAGSKIRLYRCKVIEEIELNEQEEKKDE